MKEIDSDALAGGRLADVMAARMLASDALRAKFSGRVRAPVPQPLERFAQVFGWRPPAELAEWAGVAGAYRACFDDISDVWMIGGAVGAPPKKPDLGDLEFLLLALTGLVHFGNDGSGDRCFVESLPHPGGFAGVHIFNHENGELDGAVFASIAHFVFDAWRDDALLAPADRKVSAAFAKAAHKLAAKRPRHHDPHLLFDRMKWIWHLPTGGTGYRLAEHLARAPSFAAWEEERALLAAEPVLANYWLLAHYFLGNEGACAEAVALAKRAPGKVTPALARQIEALAKAPATAKLGKVGAKVLRELRAAVRKNADASLLEPAARTVVVPKVNLKAIAARLATGADPWKVIAEHPADVAVHDLALAKLTKNAKLRPMLEAYAEARASTDVYDVWPDEWSDVKPERRLAPVVGAAFRAGLRFDADHPKAAASLANTLAWFDDDVAMESFLAALEALRMDDERLEYVVQAILASKHPRRGEVLRRAAWRFFDFFDETLASMEKAAAKGPDLDDVFEVHNQLFPALAAGLRAGDDEAIRLADKVLSYRTGLQVLQSAVGAAFALAGEKKLERHLPVARKYLAAVDGFDAEELPEDVCYNLAEAALALARLAPRKARAELMEIAQRPRGSRQLALDVLGGALAGLLVTAPKDPALLADAERILGNRVRQPRVYGPLRGIAVAKIAAGKPWVRYHLYAGCSSNEIGERREVMRAAAEALVALGEKAPPRFDEDDEFASEVSRAKLPDALLLSQKYLTEYVFRRIREENVTHPRVLEKGGEVLRDRFRFSADEGERTLGCEERREGLKTFAWLGAPALPVLRSLVELPHNAASHKTTTLLVMGIASDPPALWRRLADASAAEVSRMLEERPAESMALTDLVAAWAFVCFGAEARGAIEAALRWRVSLLDGRYDCWAGDEPLVGRLPFLFKQLPESAPVLKELGKGLDYQAREAWDRALATKVPAPQGMKGAERTLRLAPKGAEEARHLCTLSVAGKEVAVSYRGERMYFESLLDYQGEAYERKGAIRRARPEEAAALADRIAKSLQALGFQEAKSAKKKR